MKQGQDPKTGRFKKGNKLGFKKKPSKDEPPSAIADPDGAFTPAALAKVTKLASLDKSPATIATSLGLTVKAFNVAVRDNPALANALEVGIGLARDFLVDRLRKHGKKFFVSDIFAAKSLHGLTDAADTEASSPMQVVVNLPGAARTSNLVEGDLIHDDSNEPLSIESHPTRPESVEPERAAPQMAQPVRPHHTSTKRQRDALREAEFKLGIDTSRSSFTDAEWQRWTKQK